MSLLVTGTIFASVVAAIRGTWSPCGWSMYSTLTPLAEQGRGHRRWTPTMGWFFAGAVAGGAVLGCVAAAGARFVSTLHLGAPTTIAVGAGAFVAAFAFDQGLLRPSLPHHRRQVDEGWLDRYRRWVYAGGFGLQIGTGLATYVMTAGVYLVIVLGSLTARQGIAFAAGVLFGATRGSALLLAARLDRPERLRSFHRRFATLDDPVQHVVAGCWVVGAVVFAVAAGASASAPAFLAVFLPVFLLVALLTLVSVSTSARQAQAAAHQAARVSPASSGPVGPTLDPGSLDPLRPLVVSHGVGEEGIELGRVEEPTVLSS